jgi:transcriptional regulator with PAS, ATPase and Fis domain
MVSDNSTRKIAQRDGSGPRVLVVYAPNDGAPTRHVLARGRLVLGRGAGCDVVIDHGTVSRQHASLDVESDRVLLTDLGSANGTTLGGVPVDGRAVVAPLDAMISLGEVVCVLRDARETADSRAAGPVHADDRVVELVAPTQLPVLILGETGVGKEVLAERIVAASRRAGKPFVRVNCAALTESLVESELFGHERGAFTGADRQKIGLLEAASGGTVLLDEVGELPLVAQAKLLRVLESGEVTRVGSVTPVRIDARIIAATNRDLHAMVADDTFRADLLYRLDGVTIVVPPLRERRDEIAPLAKALLATACHDVGRPQPVIADDAMEQLARHDWPGNVRELRRVMERVAALLRGARVSAPDLAPLLRQARDPKARIIESVKLEASAQERERIEEALRKSAGNQMQAAKLLGISRRTLVNRLERFAMPRPRK